MWHYGLHVTDYLLDSLESYRHLKNKLVYLFDNSVVFEGITFYGTPWVRREPGWAFNKPEDYHVHIGNHIPKSYGFVQNIVNVSIRDEEFWVAYKPFDFEVEREDTYNRRFEPLHLESGPYNTKTFVLGNSLILIGYLFSID